MGTNAEMHLRLEALGCSGYLLKPVKQPNAFLTPFWLFWVAKKMK